MTAPLSAGIAWHVSRGLVAAKYADVIDPYTPQQASRCRPGSPVTSARSGHQSCRPI